MRISSRLLSVALLLAVLIATPVLAADVETGAFVRSAEGVASSAHPLAAQAGAEILAKGGNAVDAAVAVAYALAVVEPHASNLGGEGFLIISLEDGTETAIDYRSRAPLHVNVHTPGEIGSHPHGPYTTVIPGMVKGTEKALLQYGTMSLAEVLAPAMKLAEEGIVVDEFFAQAIANAYDSLLQYDAAADIWLDFGLIPDPGHVIKNPDLAHAMRLIAEHGSDVFYKGEIAEAIEEATEGWVDRESLAAYEAYERDVVHGTYRDYDIVGAPPIVAGVRVIEALNILENFDLTAYDSINSPEVAHLIAEALKLSQADYDAYVWDPNFYRVPTEGLVSKLYAMERAELIDMNKAQSHHAGDPYAFNPESDLFVEERSNESPSTTHVSVVDKDGNAVSLTQTISSFWGSRVVVPGYGFLLSNHFSQFPVFDPSDPFRPDYAAPLKSTRTTLTPTILKRDGKVKLVIGSPGSWRIPQTTVHTLVGIVDFDMEIVDAMSAPKLDAFSLDLTLEGGYPQETVTALQELGHNVSERNELDLYFGGLNVVMVEDDGTMLGVGAVRREGGASAPLHIPTAPASPDVGMPSMHDIRPGYGVTNVGWLSDYHPALQGTPGDTRVYTLDSGNPGGTAVVVGGSHGNEISGIMAATVLVEQAMPSAGRLIVVPHGNNANSDYQDGYPGPDTPEWFTVTTPEGVDRTFRYGSRFTNPAHESAPDPEVYARGDGAEHAGEEIRNVNRAHPGVSDGTLTEQIAYGMTQLLLTEQADVAIDLHEAPPGHRLANLLVAHPRGMDTAVLSILDLSMQGIDIHLEPSQEEFRGLSHREWGDATPALAFLTETANPGMLVGRHPADDEEHPLHDRVGRQLALIRAVLDAAADMGEIAPVTYDGVPTHAEMMDTSLGAWLNSATATP